VTRRPIRWLGPGSYLVFLVWVLFLIALLPDERIVPLLIAVLAFGLLNGGQGLSPRGAGCDFRAPVSRWGCGWPCARFA